MGRVIIREHADAGRARDGRGTVSIIKGSLVTDEFGVPIKTVDTVGGTSVECAALTSRTHFVALEAVDSDIRYKVRPKRNRYTPVTATDDDNPIPAGGIVFEAVYPGAIIAFLQTSQIGGAPLAFQQAYVPVLAL